MANERTPNDPFDPRSGLSDDGYRRPQRFDEGLQIDPELQEGPASSSKIALFAVAIALVLGAVFYGLNNTSVKEAQTGAPAKTAQTQSSTPQGAPPGMKANNDQPGMTTGSAATNRPTPPQSAPQGAEIDRSANPPANSNK